MWKEILEQSFAEEERPRAARQLTLRCGYAAAALTLVPLPGTEFVAVMPIHVGMVVGIAHIYGKPMSKQSASDMVMRILATAGVSLIGSRVATTAAKFLLPGLGGFIAAPFMFASTMAIGEVAKAQLASGVDLDPAEVKKVYEEAKRAAKVEFDPSEMKSAEARAGAEAAKQEATRLDPAERLERLKGLRDRGLLDEAEYAQARAKILEDL